MRFFAHDGQTLHGPAPVDELTRLPGFDGATLVCPVGSENSADWKPALAYPPFRAVLLKPTLRLAQPPAPTAPCPKCGHANPKKAKFCNDCGARMDGRVPPPPPPAPAPMAAPAPAAPPEPEFAPTPAPEPFRLPEPEPAHVSFEPAPAPYEPPSPVADIPAPAAAPSAAQAAGFKKTLIAAFIGAAAASGALGWWLLRPRVPHVPSGAELNVTPPAAPAETPPPAAAPVPSPAPIAPAADPAPVAPVAAAPAPAAMTPAPAAHAAKKARAPKIEEKPAEKPAPRKKTPARRAKKAKAAPLPAPAEESKPVETKAPEAAAAPSPAPGAPSAEDETGFMLPGVPRRIPSATKSKAKAAEPPAPAPAAAPKPDELAPPGKDAAPAAAPASGDQADAGAPASGSEDPAAGQVREQFEFCSQLLAQAAYADHFDTCLCAAARAAKPYNGSRDDYAARMKKAAAKGGLAPAAVTGVTLDGATAKVSTGKAAEEWRLEDGLWCRAK